MSGGRVGVVWGIRRDLKCFSARRNGVWDDEACGSVRCGIVMSMSSGSWCVSVVLHDARCIDGSNG